MTDCILDISHWQDIPSFWAIARSGVFGVIHKATQGMKEIDSEYLMRKARVAGMGGVLKWGAYHFGTSENPSIQAEHFLKVAGDGLSCLDWETNPRGGTMSRLQAESFVEVVKKKTGRYPVLYSGESFLNQQMKGVKDSPLYSCPLWIARYRNKLGLLFKPKVPELFGSYDMWQYTSTGKCPGINGKVDRNRWMGSMGALQRWWI